VDAILDDPNCDLLDLVRDECHDLLDQISKMTVWIEAKTKRVKVLAAETDVARRLQTMPGIGPIIALAVEAFAPDMACFKRGRDFAAWLGSCTPTAFLRWQGAVGPRLQGRASRYPQIVDHRCDVPVELVGRKSIAEGSWLARLLDRKPKMLVAIALANKMARTIWAMLTKDEDCRDPAQAAVA
jgi:transposase